MRPRRNALLAILILALLALLTGLHGFLEADLHADGCEQSGCEICILCSQSLGEANQVLQVASVPGRVVFVSEATPIAPELIVLDGPFEPPRV